MPISLLDKLRLRFGMNWRNFFEIVLTVLGIFALLFGLGICYYLYQDYFYMENQVRVKTTLADNREKTLVSVLNGDTIFRESAGFGNKRIYYCDLRTELFSNTTKQ